MVAFDTAGAYSPVFNLATNMLQYEVGSTIAIGPIVTVYNESFYYRMPSGGYTPNDPVTWQHLDIRASIRTTFNWSADQPASGGQIQFYRWRLDGNVFDDTQRTNEDTDWYHWSAPALATTSCRIGPFQPGFQRFLYIEAQDENGFKSLVTIVLSPIEPTFAANLLIVNDTRSDLDQFNSVGNLIAYTGAWPSATELDSFLFARGGYPWKNTQRPARSFPGLFAGYSFDTYDTRPTAVSTGLPSLSELGRYQHVIWIVDSKGGSNTKPLTDPNPMSALRYMCSPNRLNTLGNYVAAGGLVWLLGGDAAKASLQGYNVAGNDQPAHTITIYANAAPYAELVPGRVMYDAAHWQVEMAVQPPTFSSTHVIKSARVPSKPWTSPGWRFSRPISSPDYDQLPNSQITGYQAKGLRPKSVALGDSVPPTRSLTGGDPARFLTPGTFDAEYLTQPTQIIEDYDPDPVNVNYKSALDTLMEVKGTSLVQGNLPVAMTYYHGVLSPEFVFSGFNCWTWNRTDDIKLVDFVLQQIWHMPHNDAARLAPQSGARPAVQSQARPRSAAVPAAAVSRLPNARPAGR